MEIYCVRTKHIILRVPAMFKKGLITAIGKANYMT